MATKANVTAQKATLSPASAKSAMGIQILHAETVEITLGQPEVTPEIAQLRDDFFAGKDVSPEGLRMLVASARRSDSNANCVLC